MPQIIAVAVFAAVVVAAGQAPARRSFATVVQLETTAEDSANVSMGDLDGDGDLDLVLAKGRHTPIVDRVLLNDGKGGVRRVRSRAGGSHLHGGARGSRRRS